MSILKWLRKYPRYRWPTGTWDECKKMRKLISEAGAFYLEIPPGHGRGWNTIKSTWALYVRGTHDGDDDVVEGLIIMGRTASWESVLRTGRFRHERDFYVGFLTRKTVVYAGGGGRRAAAAAEARSPGAAPTRYRVRGSQINTAAASTSYLWCFITFYYDCYLFVFVSPLPSAVVKIAGKHLADFNEHR